MDSKKLKGKIIEKGMTQEELAQKVGVSTQTLNAKLNNKRPFTISEAEKITEVLHLDKPGEIFFTGIGL